MIWPFDRNNGPVLQNAGLRLRLPKNADYPAWHSLRTQNRAFLTPFEPTWSALDLTSTNFRNKVMASQKIARKGQEYPFLIFSYDKNSEILLGGITLSNIRYRAAQQANLGYWLGQNHTGQGHMLKATTLCLEFAFKVLNLNRVNAACLPNNAPSIKVLAAKGFVEEGKAEQFLRINGKFRDHVLFGLTADRHASFSPN